MRPSIDIDKSLHGRIEDVSDNLYDGNNTDAYTAVLERGLDHMPTPTGESFSPGSVDNAQFITTRDKEPPHDTQECSPPIVFHRDLSLNTPLTMVSSSSPSEVGFDEFEEQLTRISQMPSVRDDEAAFGIRRKGGMWVGWSFGDALAALRDPSQRYACTDFEALATEEFGLVFSVGRDYFVIRARPDHETETLSKFTVQLLKRDFGSAIPDHATQIAGELAATLRTSQQLEPPTHHSSLMTHEIDPAEFLATPDADPAFYGQIRITNPFGSDTDLPYTSDFADGLEVPDGLLIFLPHHVSREKPQAKQYKISNMGVTDTIVRNISIQGAWK